MLLQRTTMIITMISFSVCALVPPLISQETQSQSEEEAKKNFLKIERMNQQASVALRTGKYVEAHKLTKELCKLKPDMIRFQLFHGDTSFAAGKVADCIAAYDASIKIEPTLEPRLWQRGLALYYADRFADGVKQFETHQTVNSQDVENAVWHLLCAAQVSDLKTARKKLIPINRDTRVPMAEIYEMFAGRSTLEKVLDAGNKTTKQVKEGSNAHRLQQYYAHLYIGLYHEMLDKPMDALESLKKAVECNPLPKENFMGQVAGVHLKLREPVEK